MRMPSGQSWSAWAPVGWRPGAGYTDAQTCERACYRTGAGLRQLNYLFDSVVGKVLPKIC